jgi:dihydrofolate reductase
MKVSIIVAASNNNCIGKDNELPWKLSNDLKHFKKITSGHCVIMGRNTFDSIGKPLPNRVNIVLSKNEYYKQDGVVVRQTFEEALLYCKRWLQQEVFIIGGDSVYRQVIDQADKIYFTRVATSVVDGDSFFPELDQTKWELINAEAHSKDEKNEHDHIFETYIRKTSESIIYN